MNQLLEGFWNDYGLVVILIAAFVLFMVFYYVRSKRYQDTENNLHSSLKIGDKVKTYSGFYGTISNIVETTDGKVVTLQLGGDAFVDVDVRAIAGIDEKQEIVEDEKAEENLAENLAEENVESEVKTEIVEELPEKTAEDNIVESKPEEKKRGRKSKN